MKTLTCEEINKLKLSDMIIVDIRTPSEFARENIPGSINIPSDKLAEADFSAWADKTVLFYCKAGNRTQHAQATIANKPCAEKICLQGGIESWKQANNKINRNEKAPLELMRQVQIIAGLLIILGVVLSLFISPYFIILPAFVGLGLITAGVTGFCGMANLLLLLPYNKPKS